MFVCSTDLQTLPHLVRPVSIGQQISSSDLMISYRLPVSEQGQVDVQNPVAKQLTRNPPETEFAFWINLSLGFTIQGRGRKQEINAVNAVNQFSPIILYY